MLSDYSRTLKRKFSYTFWTASSSVQPQEHQQQEHELPLAQSSCPRTSFKGRHFLIPVKVDSEANPLSWALQNLAKDGDELTVLSVQKLSAATEVITGRVLEPLGEEDMVRPSLIHLTVFQVFLYIHYM
jgi:hypothetical protein